MDNVSLSIICWPSSIFSDLFNGTIPTSCFLFSLTILFISNPVWAYVDPGSGSAIVTTILGLFAAIGYSFRKSFYRIKRKFFPKKDDKEEDNEDIDEKNSK